MSRFHGDSTSRGGVEECVRVALETSIRLRGGVFHSRWTSARRGVHRVETRARRALDEYVIEGIETNISSLKKIINHKNFIDCDFDISWFDKQIENN